jgi:hypothetical protein
MRTVLRAGLVTVAVVALAGCSNSIASRDLGFGEGKAVLTQAEWRAITDRPVGEGSEHGRIRPRRVTCAEPSPDVAKAFSSSFNVGTSIVARGLPSGITPEVALAISRSQAEALAQLGERLATIQLLRDGLFRACEAFANGAISDTTYAVILSRYDDTMITMLLGEFAAGAFGRTLAALGTESSGKASSQIDVSSKQERSRQAEEKLKTSEERRNQVNSDLDKAATSAPANDPKVAELKSQLEREAKNVDNAKQELIDALKAEATSMAKAAVVTAAGGITRNQLPDVPRTLHDMQRKYIENVNFDALAIACFSAMDRPGWSPQLGEAARAYEAAIKDAGSTPAAREAAAVQIARAASQAQVTPFAVYCMTDLVPALSKVRGEHLKLILERAAHERDLAAEHGSVSKTIDAVKAYSDKVNQLLETLRPAK